MVHTNLSCMIIQHDCSVVRILERGEPMSDKASLAKFETSLKDLTDSLAAALATPG
jgi:hypothetical protein